MAAAVPCALSLISSSRSTFAYPNTSSFKATLHCQSAQIGFRSFQGLKLNNPVRTTFLQQSSMRLQPRVRITGVSVRATAASSPSAPRAPPLTEPKQKIRIKLKSYWVKRIEDSVKLILEAARSTNAKTIGPVPLPTKRRIYCVKASPFVHKDAREHFEKRTHQRLIDVENPTAHTIDALMALDIPAGVHVEVKLK